MLKVQFTRFSFKILLYEPKKMKTLWRRHNKARHVSERNIEVTEPEVWGQSWRNYECLKYFKEKIIL